MVVPHNNDDKYRTGGNVPIACLVEMVVPRSNNSKCRTGISKLGLETHGERENIIIRTTITALLSAFHREKRHQLSRERLAEKGCSGTVS